MEGNPYYVQSHKGSFLGDVQQGMGLVSQFRKMQQDQAANEASRAMEAEKLKAMEFGNRTDYTDAQVGFPTAGLPVQGQMGPSAPKPMPNSTTIPWMQNQQVRQDQNASRQDVRNEANKNRQATQSFGRENTLRDEFNQQTKPFQTIVPMYKNIIAAATLPDEKATPQTDMSLIFAYMKLLDPTSTVREGEYATAQNAGSIPDSIRNQFNRLKDGDKLQQSQRIQFAQSAQNVYKSASEIQGQHNTRYTDLAKRGGVNPDDVVYDYGAGLGGETFNQPPQQPPPTGGGKRYKILSVE